MTGHLNLQIGAPPADLVEDFLDLWERGGL